MKRIPFVGLHAHSGVGSPFDGFGYPEDHMDFAYSNGAKALALTDHGNMNGLAYQIMHAKKMQAEGKDFKPIFGVEAYFIPSVEEWKEQLEEYKKDKKLAKQIDDDQSGTTIENEGDSKGVTKHDINRRRHLVLLAQNQTGLNNIFKMVSQSYTGDNFYRYPRIDFDLLSKHSEGVIAASACLGGVYAGCYWENREEGDEAVLQAMREVTKQFQDILGDRWYGELQWNNIPEQHALNQYIIQISKETGLKLISTCDSHYPNPDAWQSRELYKRLGWLGKKPEWAEMELPLSTEEIGYELYPKNGNQMWRSYKKYSEECGVTYDDEIILNSITETHTIAFDRIESFTPDNTVRLPNFVVPAGTDATTYLGQLAFEGLVKLFEDRQIESKVIFEKYNKRLNEELDVINSRGFAKYFLTMKAIVDKTAEVQLAGPGRGSAAGSLVAYALGITQVDPIKYGLLFSRFLRSDAKDYPDIDYDVSDPMVLKDKLIDAWGDNVVVPISNWNTLQLKSLIKDIARLYEIPFTEVNTVTSKMLSEATPLAKARHGIKAGVYTPTLTEVMEFSESLQKFFRSYPQIEKHCRDLAGQVKSCSRHAGGVVIGESLNEYMPLISSKGVRQTPWSEGQNVRQLEPMGFIKFDILGLSTLRMIEDCIEKILRRHHGIANPTFEDIKKFYDANLHPDKIDLNDQAVYENIFHDGKWVGIFQFTENGAQTFAQQVKPRSIIDISAITSIYRPGPLSAGVDRQYVAAHNSPENVKYINDYVQDVTEETHGFLIFQEQIAMLAHKLGRNLTLDEGNLLRKVLTKKGTGKGHEVKDAIHEKFVLGCQDKGMPLWQAEELWKTFEYFSGYGFNKSHAVSYSIISYQCAWLCHYYSTEWTASFLDKEPEARKEKAINLAKRHGYTIQPLNVNKSGRTWEILDDTTLVAPLTTIKGLGDVAIDQIIAHRPFENIEQFLFHDKIVYSKLNKKCLDALARAGALKELQDDRFTGDKHFWTATCVDRPRKLKNLGENIEKYRPEGNFTDDERIDFLANLTGIFPINLVIDEGIQRKLDQYCIPPISEYDPELGMCWCIVREVTKKKTKGGKVFYVAKVIDNNSVETTIRCWSVNPERDILYVNKTYMIKPQYNETWGFSTRGSLNNAWVMLG